MPVALTDLDLRELRARILDALAQRAQVVGLRSVVIADLARDVGISSKTLYRCFDTKDHMVSALIERWVERLFANAAYHYRETRGDALTALKDWADAWVSSVQRFSPAFWAELERDYPRAYATYADALRELRDRARASFAGDVRADVPYEFALQTFLSAVGAAADPAFAERCGMSQRDSVLAAIDLWARGALNPRSTRSAMGRKRTPAHAMRLPV